MPEEIHNWNSLVLKGVRTSDYWDMWNIIAIYKDNIFGDITEDSLFFEVNDDRTGLRLEDKPSQRLSS